MLTRLMTAVLLAGLLVPVVAEPQDLVVDPFTDAHGWQVGGARVGYRLGRSGLEASREKSPPGWDGALKLVCDFSERRSRVSAYHTGPAIPGVCQDLAFWLYAEGGGSDLKLSLEDARGRWFERALGSVDWTGWRQIRVEVGSGADWRPLLRRGEELLPILHPVNLRQIAFQRHADAEEMQTYYLGALTARCDVLAADRVEAAVLTDRPGNLFELGEIARMTVALSNSGQEPVTGQLVLPEVATEPRDVSLLPGTATEVTVGLPTDRLGSHSVRILLVTADRTREWTARYAVTRAVAERPADTDAMFGACGNWVGFQAEQRPLVPRLNRDAGIRWTRFGIVWPLVNPREGLFAWNVPQRVDGAVGRALSALETGLSRPHAEALNCPDAVTIALWTRCAGANGAWQFLLSKWESGGPRNYGVYLHAQTGEFHFTGTFTALAGKWSDFGAGVRGWGDNWRHWAASYSREARQVRLYADGALVRQYEIDGGDLATNDGPLTLGSGFPGDMDEVMIYRRALSGAEVAALAARKAPPMEGLVAWWDGEGDGRAVEDRSGNGLDIVGTEPHNKDTARAALAVGIKTLAQLTHPPAWAAIRVGASKPKPEAWAAYVEGVVREYRDVIQHWEIWNEPNNPVFWKPKPDPQEYMDVLRVAYEAAKRGNPDCTVLMPGLAGPCEGRYGIDFLDALLEQGAARYCDAISVHPYRHGTPEETDLEGDLRHIMEMAERNGGRRPLWFTEWSWPTQIPGGSTEERQARLLARAYVIALGTGSVERFFWFRLHDSGTDRFYDEDNYGLCYSDLTPKPAYFAHKTIAELLEGARPEASWDLGPKAMGRCFRTPRGRVAALWCPKGTETVAVDVGERSVQVVDLMGNERTVATRDGVLVLEVGEDMQYLSGLPETAGPRGALVVASPIRLRPGENGVVPVAIANPLPGEERGVIRLEGIEHTFTAPGRGKVELALPVQVGDNAPVGWLELPLQVHFLGLDLKLTARVGVRGTADDAGPVGVWHLDEGVGEVLTDSSGMGHHGSVTQPEWVEGKAGRGLRFRGDGYAVVPDAPALDLRDEVTLAFWLRPEADTGTWQFPVTKYRETDKLRNYGVYLWPGRLSPCFSASLEHGASRNTDVVSLVRLTPGQWYHLVMTYSMFDETVRLYVDGETVAEWRTQEGAMLTNDEPLRIGTGTAGVIDEVVVYPRALSAEEIRGLM
ncbi:MAG: hypothetical protein HPY44_18920 [Armatimonadetes bacterium]|nr:hypothetical protein [Armatimonadota bacterium]